MVIDKNLLSKKSGQDSANELFGPCKSRLIKARGELENFVANNQSELAESIDECVKEVLHNNNRIANITDSITFKATFYRQIYSYVNDSKSIDFESKASRFGVAYSFNNVYRYKVDKNLINMDILIASELSQLKTNCEKYLANSINIGKIEIDDKANEIKVFVDLHDYITKAANDFSRFVVVYLAKQGIKSSARQTDNEVTIIIERDTDTGGFEDI